MILSVHTTVNTQNPITPAPTSKKAELTKDGRQNEYTDPSSNAVVRGSYHGVLRKTVLCEFFTGKIGLHEYRQLGNTHCPKTHTFPLGVQRNHHHPP
jgi:hypothetical protein